MIISGDRSQVESRKLRAGADLFLLGSVARVKKRFFFRTGDGRSGLGEADGVFSHKPKPAANMIGVEIGQDIARLS